MISMHTLGRAVLFLLAFAGGRALAQGMPFDLLDDPVQGPGVAAIEDDGTRPAEPRFRFALGAGVGVAPTFPGSDNYRAGLLPFIAGAYGPVVFGFNQIGVRLYRDPRWRVSTFLALAGGRYESDDARLRGLGDIDRTARLGLRVIYREGRFVALGQVAPDIAGQKQGTLARLDLLARFHPVQGTSVFVGPGLTWADRQYTQSYFGVTPEQSTRSAFPEFQTGAGLESARVVGGVLQRFGRPWFAMATVSASRLLGDAANSPVIETRTQYAIFTSVMYIF